jgi:hypothetical protein
MRFTHIHKASNTWFDLGECEVCGAAVQEVNGVSVHPKDRVKLIEIGAIEVHTLPPQLDVNEDGEAVCGNC